MKLKVLGSGSSGNLYILESSTGDILVLDCGVSFSEFRKAIKNKYSRVKGVFVTHSHIDHAKYWKQYYDKGICVFMTDGTACELKAEKHQYIAPKINWWNNVGDFLVSPFVVDHDAKDPVNFFVHHKEIGTLCYITDTAYVDVVTAPNHWIIEANHDKASLAYVGQKNPYLANRISKNHMSIETCVSILKKTGSEKCKSITLCHLSNDNSDADVFCKKVKSAIGITPNIARKGMEVEL